MAARGWEKTDERIYVDALATESRAEAPADEVAAFMARNTFHCQLLAARISEQQCEVNRTKQLYLCGKCEQVLLAAPVQPKRKAAKRRKGDNPDSPWRIQLYNRAELAAHEAKQIDVDLAADPDQTVVALVDADTLEILQILAEKYNHEVAAEALRRVS